MTAILLSSHQSITLISSSSVLGKATKSGGEEKSFNKDLAASGKDFP